MPKPPLPLIDVETYVPAAITVVRRSVGWPGLFVQERRGGAGEVRYAPGIRQHLFYLFLKSQRSEVFLDGRFQKISYQRGEGRFVPAGREVSFRWSGTVQVLMLGFEPWFLQQVAAELGASEALHFDGNGQRLAADHPACKLVAQLGDELDASPGSQLVAESLARAIAVQLLREFQALPARKPAESAPPAAVLRAVEEMRRRLAETVTLEELAAVAGQSPFHFARQFKTATGHPPHEYFIRLRVDRARELLRQRAREWTISAIAQECGFSDQSHLSRHFKRVLGVTPREFAEARHY